MILVCASCKASYLVSVSVFASGARQVRCARCGHTWQADLPPRVTVVPVDNSQSFAAPASSAGPAASVTPSVVAQSQHDEAAQTPRDFPSSAVRNLPAVQRTFSWRKIREATRVFLGLSAVGAVVWVLLATPLVDRIRHGAGRFFDAVGLTRSVSGEGFSLKQIRSERKFESGGMQLVVEGELHNDSGEKRAVPDINVNALGPEGKVIQSWRIKASTATLASGGMIPFRSSVVAPPGAVVEVNLSFVEPRHDNQP